MGLFEYQAFACIVGDAVTAGLFNYGFIPTLYILTNDIQSTKYRTLCYPIYALTSLRRLVVRRFEFVDVFPNTVKSRLGLTSQIDCIAENCRKIGTFTPYPLTSILRTQRVLYLVKDLLTLHTPKLCLSRSSKVSGNKLSHLWLKLVFPKYASKFETGSIT